MEEERIVCRPVENDAEMQAAFAVRTEVFVDEQGCPPEEEIDEIDPVAQHFVALKGEEVIGTARVYAMDGAAKIGRVAVQKEYRGQKIGAALMEAAREWAAGAGYAECVLHAQTYALGFYERMGYTAEGEEFFEANISHYRMRRKAR